MDSLDHDNQADVIEAFNSTTRYLDDLFNNLYFEGTVNIVFSVHVILNILRQHKMRRKRSYFNT